MSDDETRDKIKDWLTIIVIILYLSTNMVGLVFPKLVRELKLELDDTKELIELLR
jgi:hypothetical protein